MRTENFAIDSICLRIQTYFVNAQIIGHVWSLLWWLRRSDHASPNHKRKRRTKNNVLDFYKGRKIIRQEVSKPWYKTMLLCRNCIKLKMARPNAGLISNGVPSSGLQGVCNLFQMQSTHIHCYSLLPMLCNIFDLMLWGIIHLMAFRKCLESVIR